MKQPILGILLQLSYMQITSHLCQRLVCRHVCRPVLYIHACLSIAIRCRSIVNRLSIFGQSEVDLLPICCQSVTNLLSTKIRHVVNLLWICCTGGARPLRQGGPAVKSGGALVFKKKRIFYSTFIKVQFFYCCGWQQTH